MAVAFSARSYANKPATKFFPRRIFILSYITLFLTVRKAADFIVSVCKVQRKETQKSHLGGYKGQIIWRRSEKCVTIMKKKLHLELDNFYGNE